MSFQVLQVVEMAIGFHPRLPPWALKMKERFEAEIHTLSSDGGFPSRACPGVLTGRIWHQWLVQQHQTYNPVNTLVFGQIESEPTILCYQK